MVLNHTINCVVVLLDLILYTHGLCRESLVQCAAVKTYFFPINDPPHQNSTRLSPCKKIAANHGHSPDSASKPPTTRPSRKQKEWKKSSIYHFG